MGTTVAAIGWTAVRTVEVTTRFPEAPGGGMHYVAYVAMLALAAWRRADLYSLLIVLVGSLLLAAFSLEHWAHVFEAYAKGGIRDSQDGLGIALGPVFAAVIAGLTTLIVAVVVGLRKLPGVDTNAQGPGLQG